MAVFCTFVALIVDVGAQAVSAMRRTIQKYRCEVNFVVIGNNPFQVVSVFCLPQKKVSYRTGYASPHATGADDQSAAAGLRVNRMSKLNFDTVNKVILSARR
jgi:hypothetical protein